MHTYLSRVAIAFALDNLTYEIGGFFYVLKSQFFFNNLWQILHFLFFHDDKGCYIYLEWVQWKSTFKWINFVMFYVPDLNKIYILVQEKTGDGHYSSISVKKVLAWKRIFLPFKLNGFWIKLMYIRKYCKYCCVSFTDFFGNFRLLFNTFL